MNSQVFDVAIVGGGVVGCSVLRELTSRGIKCILCEQNDDILSGASSGNSGTLHTGFDAPLNSIELDCIRIARELSEDFFIENNVPFRTSGALIVAWTKDDLEKLPGIVNHSCSAGITDVRQITRDELLKMEPCLNQDALGAVYVPRETIVDPWAFPASLAFLGLSQGGTILTGCKVEGGAQFEWGWKLSTSKGPIQAKLVINCAGLFGDIVEEISRPSPFTIKPRKGQFAVFGQSAKMLLKSIIFPVPTERTKGVLLFPSVYGNIVVGPTAEDQEDRQQATIDQTIIDGLIKRAHYMVPLLRDHGVVGTYAGLRPATEYKDYQIDFLEEKDWITVGGIRSTGLSSCLGIAKHVASCLKSKFKNSSYTNISVKADMSKKHLSSDDKAVIYRDQKWKITHPLTEFGISTSKGLEQFKSFLG
ncbi:hypothetical protein QZH41_007238 [Actinostola sp. cb2023]|nr:hypothetical protein QZH41_007238 [Actinostola sp. cb2023]